MKIRIILIGFFLMFGLISIKAQNYKLAAGVRVGFPTGLNGKYFLDETDAVEATISAYRGGFELNAFYEIHDNAFEIPFLNWYYGGGIHIGAFANGVARPAYFIDRRGDGFTTGLDGIIGLEYRMTERPYVIGVDMKPTLDLLPDPFFYVAGALSFRVYF